MRDPLLELNKRLYAEAAPERLEKDAFIGKHPIIEATHLPTGIRSRFEAVEHQNIGPGWTMRDLDGQLSGFISDLELIDLEAAPDEVADSIGPMTKIGYIGYTVSD